MRSRQMLSFIVKNVKGALWSLWPLEVLWSNVFMFVFQPQWFIACVFVRNTGCKRNFASTLDCLCLSSESSDARSKNKSFRFCFLISKLYPCFYAKWLHCSKMLIYSSLPPVNHLKSTSPFFFSGRSDSSNPVIFLSHSSKSPAASLVCSASLLCCSANDRTLLHTYWTQIDTLICAHYFLHTARRLA